ncbi:MAG: carboxylesterase [Proteobacteria bacterium]|nr:carboxylesterase [Pseudomonadota bacterium]
MAPKLETVEHGPANAKHSILWLHGLGADGHDFEPVIPELALPPSLEVRFVFPHAPVRPVTLNGGYRMRAWFDLKSIDRNGPLDREGLLEAMGCVDELIAREAERGVPAERLVLAGFSQGGALALSSALRSERKLAGILGLSTFLMSPEAVALPFTEINHATPMFLAHGRQDTVVPFALGRATRDYLVSEGFSPEWHEYDMPHSVCAEEIRDIRTFLLNALAEGKG